MKLFDTHCHFDTKDKAVVASILRSAREAGVERLMAVGGSPDLNEAALIAAKTAAEAPENYPEVLCACGHDRDQVSAPRTKVTDYPLAAWGEIGLDYFYSPETRSSQLELFASELECARQRHLPVIIHTREADDDTLGVLREVESFGVIHCFTGSPEFGKKLLDLGFYISISGIVTFRAADNVRETALSVPDDRLLIETDSPFLAPVPMRGKPNCPAYVRYTAEFLAALRGTDAESLAALTFENGTRLFHHS